MNTKIFIPKYKILQDRIIYPLFVLMCGGILTQGIITFKENFIEKQEIFLGIFLISFFTFILISPLLMYIKRIEINNYITIKRYLLPDKKLNIHEIYGIYPNVILTTKSKLNLMLIVNSEEFINLLNQYLKENQINLLEISPETKKNLIKNNRMKFRLMIYSSVAITIFLKVYQINGYQIEKFITNINLIIAINYIIPIILMELTIIFMHKKNTPNNNSTDK